MNQSEQEVKKVCHSETVQEDGLAPIKVSRCGRGRQMAGALKWDCRGKMERQRKHQLCCLCIEHRT